MKDSKANGNTWRRILVIAILPLTILFWITGWTFYWLGDQKNLTTIAKTKPIASFKQEEWKNNREKEAAPQPIFS